jgi:LSD1 subclass zinc finger protein
MSTTMLMTCGGCAYSWHVPLSAESIRCPECKLQGVPRFKAAERTAGPYRAAREVFDVAPSTAFMRGYSAGYRAAMRAATGMVKEKLDPLTGPLAALAP